MQYFELPKILHNTNNKNMEYNNNNNNIFIEVSMYLAYTD